MMLGEQRRASLVILPVAGGRRENGSEPGLLVRLPANISRGRCRTGVADKSFSDAAITTAAKDLETTGELGTSDAAGPLLHIGACRGVHVRVGDDVADREAPAGPQHPRGLTEDLALVRRQG